MEGPGKRSGTAPLDARSLRLFDLLYRTRSVTRAAEQLGQAQPTVSIWLNRLRRDLHDPLFVRTRAGMEPTPRADALIGMARTALDALQRLTEADTGFDPASSHQRFRICMTDASHVTLLPRLLGRLRTVAPLVRVEVLQIDAQTEARLQSGEADLALGLIPELEVGFYQQSLYVQDWVCLVNPRHPRIGKRLDRAAYEAEGHIAIASTGYRLLEAAVASARVQRHVVLDLPGFLGLGALIQATDLIATLPRHTGETLAATNGLAAFPAPVPIPSFSVKLHWHARYHHDAGNRWLRALCADLFQQHTSRPFRG
jgi:DNA-binding transcriptional LysR family regulator